MTTEQGDQRHEIIRFGFRVEGNSSLTKEILQDAPLTGHFPCNHAVCQDGAILVNQKGRMGDPAGVMKEHLGSQEAKP